MKATITKMREVKTDHDLLHRGQMISANIAMQKMNFSLIENEGLLNQAQRENTELKKEYQDLLKRQVQSKMSAAKEKEEAAAQLSNMQEENLALRTRCEELLKSQAQLRETVRRADEVYVKNKEEIANLKDVSRSQKDEIASLRLENERLMRLLGEKMMPLLVDLPEDCQKTPDKRQSALRGSREESDVRAVQEA